MNQTHLLSRLDASLAMATRARSLDLKLIPSDIAGCYSGTAASLDVATDVARVPLVMDSGT